MGVMFESADGERLTERKEVRRVENYQFECWAIEDRVVPLRRVS